LDDDVDKDYLFHDNKRVLLIFPSVVKHLKDVVSLKDSFFEQMNKFRDDSSESCRTIANGVSTQITRTMLLNSFTTLAAKIKSFIEKGIVRGFEQFLSCCRICPEALSLFVLCGEQVDECKESADQIPGEVDEVIKTVRKLRNEAFENLTSVEESIKAFASSTDQYIPVVEVNSIMFQLLRLQDMVYSNLAEAVLSSACTAITSELDFCLKLSSIIFTDLQ